MKRILLLTALLALHTVHAAEVKTAVNPSWTGDCDNQHPTERVLRKAVRGVAYKISKKFGNLAGAIKLRPGRLKHDQKVYALLDGMLRPGDILFEKTSAALTDKLIPGRLGHVAIYLGRGWELANLGYKVERAEGMTDDEYSVQLQSPWVVEALRPGVTTNSFEHFMNVDEVFVLRPNYTSDSEIRATFDRAFTYLGFQYDFLFDLQDDADIYCTELITRALYNHPWDLKYRLGVWTIDPDALLIQSMTRMSFEPVAAYFDKTLHIEKGPELRTKLEHLFKIQPDGKPLPPGDSQL